MITIAVDPTTQLTTPSSDAGDYMTQTRLNCGLVAGGVDAFITFLTGFSPLEEWVFKPLTGDWRAMAAGADAWSNAGRSVEIIASEIEAMVNQVDDRWTGGTFDNYVDHQARLVADISELPPACTQLSEMTTALLAAAKGIADLIATAVDIVVSLALQIMAEAAVPVIGEAAMVASVTAFGVRVAQWSTKLSQAIMRFAQLVPRIVSIVNRVLTVTQKVVQMLSKLSSFDGAQAATKTVVATVLAADAYDNAMDKLNEPVDMPNLVPTGGTP